MPLLSVNIDHVATVRQARMGAEPDPVRAAHEAEMGGADGITVHLREDRRHIQDTDVERLRALINVRFNLEMAATDEMIEVAERIGPDTVMFVPEGRHEVTTEGGLDVAGQVSRLKEINHRLKERGAMVSAFIDAEPRQIDACVDAGFDVCEVHTGPYSISFAQCGGDFARESLAEDMSLVESAGKLVLESGMRFNAGHGLNYHNVQPIAGIPGISELHIGHSIVSRAIYVGIRQATQDMRHLLESARGATGRN